MYQYLKRLNAFMIPHTADGKSRRFDIPIRDDIIRACGKINAAGTRGKGFLRKPEVRICAKPGIGTVPPPPGSAEKPVVLLLRFQTALAITSPTPPPRMLLHSCWFITCHPSGHAPRTWGYWGANSG